MHCYPIKCLFNDASQLVHVVRVKEQVKQD